MYKCLAIDLRTSTTMNLQMNRWILIFAALVALASAADSDSKYTYIHYVYSH